MNDTSTYYKLKADKIYEDINTTIKKSLKVTIESISFVVFPHVYPSHKFRTTNFILKNMKNLIKDKKICDMGCGPGIIGLFSIYNGAKEVVQADINPHAIENAKHNNLLHNFTESKTKAYLSDCFENVPQNIFDIIIFNMPFHSDEIQINDSLKYAFYDPAFKSIKKFLDQAKSFMHQKTKIFIAFSNKGDTQTLENIFDRSELSWTLWKKINAHCEFDNRIYKLEG